MNLIPCQHNNKMYTSHLKILTYINDMHQHNPLQSHEKSNLIIEKANLEDVFHVGHSICHIEITERVSEQNNVPIVLQLFKIFCVPQGTIMLVINMNQLSFKAFQNSLQDKAKVPQHSYIL